MKTTGIIVFRTASAKEAAASLAPDNGGYMECRAEGDAVCASVSGDSLRTIIATVDDYLMNLSVADQLVSAVGKKQRKN